jgi:hypothetical protein
MCDIAQFRRALERAVARLYQRDALLTDGEAHEQAITARLAHYLDEDLPGLDVDCEYNRDARDPTDVKRNGQRARMRPDIVVHRRRTTENFLAVEVKPYWSQADRAPDYEKLRELTGERFRYRLGVHVELTRTDGVFVWFRNGQEVDALDE